MAFATQEDIGNRALQHCGARRLVSFSDVSRNAQEVSFAYDKLRAAELRRAVWRFATRRAVLRAISPTTLRFVPPLWNSGQPYTAGQIVQDSSSVYWIAVVSNINRTPGVPVPNLPSSWAQYFGPVYGDVYSSTTTYYAGDIVFDGTALYVCQGNNVLNSDPTSGLSSKPWVQQLPPLVTFVPVLLSPAGFGLTLGSAKTPRNIFPLPNGFLRLAAPDPKFASASVYATTGAIKSRDWVLENRVLISAEAGPILPFRFVADLSDVSGFDPLFCEALGARIGYEVCETLTQSAEKKKDIGAAYQKFMAEARMVNQIEIGSTEADEEAMQAAAGEGGAPQAPTGASARA